MGIESIEQIQRVVGSALGGKVTAKLMASGVNNLVYSIRLDISDSDVRVGGREFVLRVPARGKQLMSYGAISNQQIKARFQLFATSGYCPQVVDVDLPDDISGAIVCDYIPGRIAQFPDDLSLIVQSLAVLHSCEREREAGADIEIGADVEARAGKQTASQRPPQPNQLVDYATMMQVIEQRMEHLNDVATYISMSEPARKIIWGLAEQCLKAPLDEITAYEQCPNTPMLPILKDANPGNFIISSDYPPRSNAMATRTTHGQPAGPTGEEQLKKGVIDSNEYSTNGHNKEGNYGGENRNSEGNTSMPEDEIRQERHDTKREPARAIVVDVEGDFYGLPIIDVGHSSLYSAAMWEDDSISPLSATKILQLYEEYFARLAEINGEEFVQIARPPATILCNFRIATLCRCLTWMINLIYLAEKQKVQTTPEKLARAKLILSEENLHHALNTEKEIQQLLTNTS